MTNFVYIATSLDSYIADKSGGLDWLHQIPDPGEDDFGFSAFMSGIDAVVMGRRTFDQVCCFDGDWPYRKPVFVLSRSLTEIPAPFSEKAELISGSCTEIVDFLHQNGFSNLYVDGGNVIQDFLKADLIDEMIVTSFPVLLGGGTSLFGELAKPMKFTHVKTEVLVKTIVQTHYRRER